MNQKALHTLEYHKIIDRLTGLASSRLGREALGRLTPLSDLSAIEQMQAETEAALGRLLRNGTPSFHGVHDIRPALRRMEVGSSLNIAELLSLADLLENTARIKAYARSNEKNPSRAEDDTEEEASSMDCLTGRFHLLEPLTPLSTEIRRCLLSESEVSDDASPALRHIRRQIQICEDRIHTQLAQFLNGPMRNTLQDGVIAMRNNRYCLPVRAEHKNSVPGMVHDQSASGATLFIEPMSVVKLNNDIRDLEAQEKKEIDVILSTLTASAAEKADLIRTDLDSMVELDLIFARGRLALDMNATRPVLRTDGILALRKARHPLIDKKSVVPIDIRLGSDFHLLIITGPNTGGKTVSLKTVGLLTLMAQSGLHIPALDRSEISVFQEIYADIGDEQSIEQSLSTFSSHMTHIVSFLEKADPDSLVLFDELGAGTDPTEGAALAIAILSTLKNRGVRTMATTHYSELKVYALSTPGVENASCEFDVNTLRPTYRLLIGVPGRSNAFAISSKLGLPDYIIDMARDQISEKDESLEDVLSTLEQNRIRIEQEQNQLRRDRDDLNRQLSQLKNEQNTLRQQKDKILKKADEEAHAILQEAKEYADKTLKEFRRFGKSGIDSAAMERERNELRKKLEKTAKKNSIQPTERTGKVLKPSDLHPGDSVKVLSMNLKGTVSSRVDDRGYLFVTMGIIRSKLHISDLELLEDEPKSAAKHSGRTGSGKIKISKSMSVGTEIKLLGKTVDEALAELDKYLDDAYLAHLPSVRVVHGKGTGALRKGVHNYLRRQSHVKEFHLAEFGEGDAGVTIVTFR